MPILEANTCIQAMPFILFNVNGIQNLLSNLDPNKAHGPDGISPYILKSCSAEIAPILEVIFKQSLNTGELQSDWLTANIFPVFKKGNRIKLQTNISNIILLQNYGAYHFSFNNGSHQYK